MSPSRVMLFSEYGALNGGEFSFLTALPFLESAGFEFTALLPRDSGFAKLLERSGVKVQPFSFYDPTLDSRKTQQQIRSELSDAIGRIKPNIVHANSLAASRILGPVAASAGVLALGYVRDIIKLSRKAMDDINQLDRLVAVSHATANFHIDRGIDSSIVRVVYNGVDLGRFRPRANRPDGKQRICLSIGQIGIRKGLDLTLEMMAKVCRQNENVELWIVGERHSQKDEAVEYERKLRSFAKANFSQPQIHWLGRRDDIASLMRHADVLVHAARQEPLGRVLIEAAASGLPTVTTNVGGSPEIFRTMESFLFSLDRFSEAESLVNRLLNEDSFWQQTSETLRSIAEKKFSAEIAGESLLNCYHELIA